MRVSSAVTTSTDTLVVQWNGMGLEAVRRSTLGAPMIARAMAILHTSIYDAWAAYDVTAVGTRLGAQLRQPVGERTARNRNAALSYAAYTAAVDLWPESKVLFDEFMLALGYPPDRRTTTAGSVGVAAAEATLEFRHGDGANQLGDLHPGPYSDYTGYQPLNRPMVVAEPLDPATVPELEHWQPLVHPDRTGQVLTQTYVGPHRGRVRPFALTSWDQFRPPPPARLGAEEYTRQA
jgi:hypothetical protein